MFPSGHRFSIESSWNMMTRAMWRTCLTNTRPVFGPQLRIPERHASVHFLISADCSKFVIYNCDNWDIMDKSSAHKPKWGKNPNPKLILVIRQSTNTKYELVHTLTQIHKGILQANTYCTILNKILWFS